jgi:hypothetical protein
MANVQNMLRIFQRLDLRSTSTCHWSLVLFTIHA